MELQVISSQAPIVDPSQPLLDFVKDIRHKLRHLSSEEVSTSLQPSLKYLNLNLHS